MKIEQGEFRGPLTVDFDRQIHGAVIGPVTVEAGATLVVKGSLSGPVTIADDSIVMVYGAFYDTDELRNAGLLMLAGTTDHRFSAASGRIAVAAGTLITDRDWPEVVQSDGSTTDVPQGAKLDIHTDVDDYLRYDAKAGMFHPIKAA